MKLKRKEKSVEAMKKKENENEEDWERGLGRGGGAENNKNEKISSRQLIVLLPPNTQNLKNKNFFFSPTISHLINFTLLFLSTCCHIHSSCCSYGCSKSSVIQYLIHEPSINRLWIIYIFSLIAVAALLFSGHFSWRSHPNSKYFRIFAHE